MDTMRKSVNAKPSAEPTLEDFEVSLTRALGAVVGGGDLSRALGYRTQAAFRQALARDRLPVRVFEIEGRRGRFARTGDIARWLWGQGVTSLPATPGASPKEDSTSRT